MQDLGVLPGAGVWAGSRAVDFNESGQFVGVSGVISSSYTGNRAFLWTSDSGMQDLGELPGVENYRASGVNNNGEVVGWGQLYGTDQPRDSRAFIWTSSDGMRNLNDLLVPADSGWTLWQARAINDVGQIVGIGVNPDGYWHGFLLTPNPEPSALALVGCALTALTLTPMRRRSRG